VNIVYPTMAQDELPRAVLAGAAGGRARDQNGNPDGGIYSTPAEASLARLCAFLRGLLSPDDMAQAETLIGQLFADSDPTDVGSAMAGDRAVSVSYEPRFPNHGRLGRWFS
jgi:hypothetical protein